MLLEVELGGRIERAKIVVCDGVLELFRAGDTFPCARCGRGRPAGHCRSGFGLAGDTAAGTVVAVHVTSVSR